MVSWYHVFSGGIRVHACDTLVLAVPCILGLTQVSWLNLTFSDGRFVAGRELLTPSYTFLQYGTCLFVELNLYKGANITHNHQISSNIFWNIGLLLNSTPHPLSVQLVSWLQEIKSRINHSDTLSDQAKEAKNRRCISSRFNCHWFNMFVGPVQVKCTTSTFQVLV